MTFERAVGHPGGTLLSLQHDKERFKFVELLLKHRVQIEHLVSLHLSLSSTQSCTVPDIEEWFCGGYNIDVPVSINNRKPGLVLVRFPMPFQFGEIYFPGNVDEKLRCEVATHLWIQEHCPSIPIPRILGVALTGSRGQTFTDIHLLPLYKRMYLSCRQRALSFFCGSKPSPLVPVERLHDFDVAYSIMDFVEPHEGSILDKSWTEGGKDCHRRANFYCDIAQIMLELGSVPLPRIGAYTIDNYGMVSLANRALTSQIAEMERTGMPTNMTRKYTYNRTDEYMQDILHLHDNRLLCHPNAVLSRSDGLSKMAVLYSMRSILPEGMPNIFFLQLTDLSTTNIFVDDDWHVVRITDLAWTCSLPASMQNVPYKLCDLDLNCTVGDRREVFEKRREEFMQAFQEVEMCRNGTQCTPKSIDMETDWQEGRFWQNLALSCLTGFYEIFTSNFDPYFATDGGDDEDDEETKQLAERRHSRAMDVLEAKISEKETYDNELSLVLVDSV